MINPKLLAALVGLLLAAGALGTASAQTAVPTTTQSASPSDATAPATAAKNDTSKKALISKHHARMTSKAHRKHVSLLTGKPVPTKHVAGNRAGVKVARQAGKRFRMSHLVKHGTPKHV